MHQGPTSLYSPRGRAGAADPSKAQVGAGGEKLGGEGDGSVWRQDRQTVIPGPWEHLTSVSSHPTLSFSPIYSQYQKQPNEGCNW